MASKFKIRVGEPLVINIDIEQGDIAEVSQVAAILKKAGPSGTIPSGEGNTVGTFIVRQRDISENGKDGWELRIPPEETDDYKPGLYITNAELLVNNFGPIKTDPMVIEVLKSVI